MIYIGIDPGKSGGICVMDDKGGIELVKMPSTELDIYESLDGYNGFAMIEKVQGYIGNAHPGTAMFKFGASYGGLRMALIASGIPFDEVSPRTWQKTLGISPRKKTESKGQFKNRIKAKAQQLFPNENVTLATCDALLIAEYCRRATS
jgi:hypothetical protein